MCAALWSVAVPGFPLSCSGALLLSHGSLGLPVRTDGVLCLWVLPANLDVLCFNLQAAQHCSGGEGENWGR